MASHAPHTCMLPCHDSQANNNVAQASGGVVWVARFGTLVWNTTSSTVMPRPSVRNNVAMESGGAFFVHGSLRLHAPDTDQLMVVNNTAKRGSGGAVAFFDQVRSCARRMVCDRHACPRCVCVVFIVVSRVCGVLSSVYGPVCHSWDTRSASRGCTMGCLATTQHRPSWWRWGTVHVLARLECGHACSVHPLRVPWLE